jgi:GNAT superfamily N-acetyltransferase
MIALVAPVRRCAGTLRRAASQAFAIRRVRFFEAMPIVHDEAPARLPGIDFVVADARELARHAAQLVSCFAMTDAQLQRRVNKGCVALLALAQEQVVGMLWLTFGPQDVSEIGAVLSTGPGDFISFDERTLPAYRGRGIAVALNRQACSYARSRGAMRQLLWRVASNKPALRVAQKAGQRCVATAVAVTLLGVNRCITVRRAADARLDLH